MLHYIYSSTTPIRAASGGDFGVPNCSASADSGF